DAFHVNVNPRIRNCALALDSHRCADQFQCCDLAQWDLCASGRGNDDLLERLKIFAKISIVTKIDAVTLKALHRGRQRHATERHFEHFLHVANGKSVARDLVAINIEFDVVATHHAFAKNAGSPRHLAHHCFDLPGDPLKFRKVWSGDLDAHRSFDSSGEHIDPRFDRHGPSVV